MQTENERAWLAGVVFAAVSMASTIAFGVLALGGLLVAGLWRGDLTTCVSALLAAGASYVAQAVFTAGDHDTAAEWLRRFAVGFWLTGLLSLSGVI